MEGEYLSNKVIVQIKDFAHHRLNAREKSLIDKLILNEELKKRYKSYGLCGECNQPNTGKAFEPWCQSCNAKHFQEKFQTWTSGNPIVDEFIQNSQLNAKILWEILEWLDYDRFENVEYIATGGFGTIYKANWKDGAIDYWNNLSDRWVRNNNIMVALKCLNKSKDISSGFLNEIKLHLKLNSSSSIVRCYGITKDPKTGNFMMVMQYAEKGNLRQILNGQFSKMNWKNKIDIIRNIALGLIEIHKEGLTHQDLHSGNILSFTDRSFSITDLGLCKPASEKSETCNKQIYGVLPYVAPEILRGKEYTQESDIYSFGIVIFEICTGLPPYRNIAHDQGLAFRICQGIRPKSSYKIPSLILNLIKKCWDADPLKRPKAGVLSSEFTSLYLDLSDENTEISKQIIEIDEKNKKRQLSFSNYLSPNGELQYTTHSQAIYTSKLLDFKILPEPINADDDSDDDDDDDDDDRVDRKSTEIDFADDYNNDDDGGQVNFDYSKSTMIDFTKIPLVTSGDKKKLY